MENLKFNLALFILRIFTAGLLFPHGIAKAINGIDGMVEQMGTFAYAVFIGQIFAPICLILGIIPRIASTLIVITMLVSITVHHDIFSFDDKGSITIEKNLLYIVSALTTAILGSGKWSLYNKY